MKAELEKDFISPQTGSVVAPAGSTLPGAPESVFSVLLDNTWELSGGMRLSAALNAYYQSDTENFVNQSATLNKTYDAFTLLNVNMTLTTDAWSAMLYIRNLGDEEGASGGFPSAYWSYDTGVFENWYGNGNRQFIVQPRTIGVKLGYRF